MIGLDYYFSIVTGRTLRGPPGSPVAVESNLGWMVPGRSNTYSSSNEVITNLVCAGNVVDLDEEVELTLPRLGGGDPQAYKSMQQIFFTGNGGLGLPEVS